jgi:hypothetical protein
MPLYFSLDSKAALNIWVVSRKHWNVLEIPFVFNLIFGIEHATEKRSWVLFTYSSCQLRNLHSFTVLLYSFGSSRLRPEYDTPGELFVLGWLKGNSKGTPKAQASTFSSSLAQWTQKLSAWIAATNWGAQQPNSFICLLVCWFSFGNGAFCRIAIRCMHTRTWLLVEVLATYIQVEP